METNRETTNKRGGAAKNSGDYQTSTCEECEYRYQERAAIMEIDGGASKRMAEEQALCDDWRCVDCKMRINKTKQ